MPTPSARRLLPNLPVMIIVPVILCVTLFFMTIFLMVLPTLKSALMNQRRNLIHELTEVAWSTLNLYYAKESTGELTRETAQALAVEHLRHLRYGLESKDYFWIHDMHPRIIMHPYRTDLEGKDVRDYADPNGKRLFVEASRIANSKGAGYLDYQWQWMDDPGRIVPKISFVKEFRPWNWVIGTGIYIEDIQLEISAMTKKLTLSCLGILVFVFLLSSLIVWQGIKVAKERQRLEKEAGLQREQLYQTGKMATVGTLAAGVAHEINNPVTAILLNVPILNKVWSSVTPILSARSLEDAGLRVQGMDAATLYDRTPQLLMHIEDGARRIKNIVNELKDFARLSPPEMVPGVCINLAVEKAVALVSNMISQSTSFFSSDYAPDLPPFTGNIQKVEQVIINLLVNACEALENKQQSIRVTTGLCPESGQVLVAVSDEGRGMSSHVRERIDDPFFTTKQTAGNTGLGLAISARIMKDHGGKMDFDTALNEGTTVTLYFPADNAAKKGDL